MMNKNALLSWIFLSVALAAGDGAAGPEQVSSVADGINHAIPEPAELSASLNWLVEKGLLLKEGELYRLSASGRKEYALAARQSTVLMKVWEQLELQLMQYT